MCTENESLHQSLRESQTRWRHTTESMIRSILLNESQEGESPPGGSGEEAALVGVIRECKESMEKKLCATEERRQSNIRRGGAKRSNTEMAEVQQCMGNLHEGDSVPMGEGPSNPWVRVCNVCNICCIHRQITFGFKLKFCSIEHPN